MTNCTKGLLFSQSAICHTPKVNGSGIQDKAILTLADGSTIVPDDVYNGTLLQQGNTRLKVRGTRYEEKNRKPTSNTVMFSGLMGYNLAQKANL